MDVARLPRLSMLLLSKLYWDCEEMKRKGNEGGEEVGRGKGRGRTQVEVSQRQGLRGSKEGRVTLGREMWVVRVMHSVCGGMRNYFMIYT